MHRLLQLEHRCQCGKLLLKGLVFDGFIEIKCKRCEKINQIGNLQLPNDDKHYVIIIDGNGIVVNVSISACNILGYAYEELVGLYFTQINPSMPKEIGERFFGLKTVLHEDHYFQIDTIHQAKSGEIIPINAFLKLFKPNNNEQYVLLLAELKKNQNFNSTTTQKSPKFIENACDFYFDIDENGLGEYISPEVTKLFGFSQEKCIGKNYFNFLAKHTTVKAKDAFEYFSANRQPFKVSHECGKDAFGNTINNQLFFTPKFSDSGKFAGYRVLGWVIPNAKSDKSKV